jgi:predicted ATPase/class 3 adenylate cyclase
MTFDEVLAQVLELLHRQGRVSYRALKLRFSIDDNYIDGLKDELIYAQRVASDEDNRVLVWTGNVAETVSLPTQEETATQVASLPSATRPREAERRQLTVMFCDLVDSTKLSSQLDPEDYREVIRQYQQVCAEAIQRYDGHVAQLLGDGLLVYFGYPVAHEDDARRAVHTGLEMLDALEALNTRLAQQYHVRVAVRIGIHTGLVVVGEMGGGGRYEQLALGEAPNVASRLQGLAPPNTVLISADTHRLVQGYFTLENRGVHTLKGASTPMHIYCVRGESPAESRFEAATATGLTPLVGRDEEIGLLLRCWDKAKEGAGQVVLLAGEAGIGKSRIVQTLREYLADEPHIRLRGQCLPYYTNSAYYPFIAHLERAMACERDAPPAVKLTALESLLAQAGASVEEVVPLFAALLSIPSDDRYPPLVLSPQHQKDKTMQALIDQVRGLAQQCPVVYIFEDVHWLDPTSLEVVHAMIARVQDMRVLLVLTYRPEFTSPWSGFTHVTTHTLNRLDRQQVVAIVERVTAGKVLPQVVLDQIIAKTDGIPLFVEELTKTTLESGWLTDDGECYRLTGPLPHLAIPDTLQGSLMARLDHLAPVKETAQIGAVIGREFAYELLAAVSPLPDAKLQEALYQLVQAELVFRRGQPPEATYIFKHALIQDAAYQSLLKRTRQQYHQRIAQVLEARFSELVETQPELLAHHYTEAGLPELAIPYWQRAGQRALQRSANQEAISHGTRGLELLLTLPETPERAEQELLLQTTLGPALLAAKGYAAPEVGRAYTRAWDLCQQGGDMHQIVPIQYGLWVFHIAGAEYQTAHQLATQLFHLAQGWHDPIPLLAALRELGGAALMLGQPVPARGHLEQALALYDPQQHGPLAFRYGHDVGTSVLAFLSLTLWLLGYPDQARQKSTSALTLAQELAHANSLASTLVYAAVLRQWRAELHQTHTQSEAALTFTTTQQIPFWSAMGTILRGWTLARQGKGEEGIAEIRQGLADLQGTGARYLRSYWLALLAEAYDVVGQPAAGLAVLNDALDAVHTQAEHYYEAELYRLKGTLLFKQADLHASQAAACFHQALDIARSQQAKSLELRAATSLAKLWQRQGKRKEAYALLAPIYHWFTEGFDTADLRDAKALLDQSFPEAH